MSEKAPGWDLTGIEGYGGGKVVSWLPLIDLGYSSIYWRKKYVSGATRGPRGWGTPTPWAGPPASWPPCCVSDFHSNSLGLRLFQERSSRRFHSAWFPFGIPFLQNTEIGKKTETGTRPSVNRLGPKII